MTLISFLRLFIKRLPWLIIFPVLLAGLVIYLTKNMPREYMSSTVLYTGLASGNDITADQGARIDFFAVNNAFDNIITTTKSRETIEEVGMRLLAQHLIQKKPEYTILNEKSFERLQELIPDSARKRLVVPGNFDSTYARLVRVRTGSSVNIVADILNNTASHYSVASIMNRLTVQRKGNSDMLEITFRADDQAVVLHTLRFITDAFMERFKSLKGSETSTAVKYFEEQLRKALIALRAAEERLKDFGVENRIINYDEQSKFIAESKEDMTTAYYQEVMRFSASKAAVERLERKLDEREVVIGNNRDIMDKRAELSAAERRLANAIVYESSPEEVAALRDEVDVLTEELRELARKFYKLNNTVESVAQRDLVTQWLNKVLEYEESAARITVFEKRLKEYDQIYDEFAPLGSEITRLIREVDVAEKEYLSVLHGLNLAKLRQQNVEIANSLTIMDHPYFPLTPLPSKRRVLILASFMAGFILLLGFYVAQEMLDHAVRTPEKAVAASGLPLAGALPSYRRPKQNVKLGELEHSLTEQLVTSITIALKKSEKISTYYQVNIFSARQGEGKTWFSQRIATRFAETGSRVLYLYPETSQLGKYIMHENVTAVSYKVTGALVNAAGIQDLLEGTGHSSFEFGYVFLELPHLSQNSVPYELAAQAHVSLLVMNAEKVWSKANERANILYQKAAKNMTMLVLNRVTPEMLESVYGEIPKKRSTMRRLLKKVVSMGAV